MTDLRHRTPHSVYRGAAEQQEIRAWCARRLDEWTLRHRRQEVPTDIGPTHVVTVGSGPRTVVVLPGTNMNAAVSQPLAAALASRCTALLVDLPGQPGLSVGTRPLQHRTAWYAHWLADLMRRAAPQGAVVLGHSLGGALALACDAPGITGRVLVAPGGLVRLKLGAGLVAATLPWMLRPTPRRSAALLQHFLAPGHQPPPLLQEWYTLVARTCRTSLAPAVLPARVTACATGVPLVIAAAEHDAFLPPRRLQHPAHLLGTELEIITGAGHLVTEERPQAVAELI